LPLARILRRTLWLILLGLVMNWLMRPTAPPWAIRASGVLQRIGVVYLFCALLAGSTRRALPALLAATLLIALHGLVLLYVPAPGEARASLVKGLGLSAWLDRTLLPGRLPRSGYDPEGVLSSLSAIASGLAGLGVARVDQAREARGKGSAGRVLIAAAALAAGGLALTPLLPLNKQLWTPSFALVTTGAALLTFQTVKSLWPFVSQSVLARAAALLGRTALTFYVLHMAVIAVLLLKIRGARLWDLPVRSVSALGVGPEAASLAFALLLGLVIAAAMPALARRGLLIRL
jgi:predicted acyltransferase